MPPTAFIVPPRWLLSLAEDFSHNAGGIEKFQTGRQIQVQAIANYERCKLENAYSYLGLV
jgi:hypothetical protein